jgi:Cu(I)/Ag(I) efflux system membrane fusion protein
MYVDARMSIPLSPAVVVPLTAVLSTGHRNVVWVENGAGKFEPRFVEIGDRSDEFVQILHGIEEGDRVVTSGGYLLDSESQLQAGSHQ